LHIRDWHSEYSLGKVGTMQAISTAVPQIHKITPPSRSMGRGFLAATLSVYAG